MSSTDNVNNATTATIHWNPEGTPVATDYDDVYFSVDNGLAESRYVFIEQNQLSERWLNHPSPCYTIAETGFGTGLNFLATWQHYQQHLADNPNSAVKRLHFVSFEKHPLALKDLSQALKQWPELAEYSKQLIQFYPAIMTLGCHRITFHSPLPITLDLWIGDVHENMPEVPNTRSGLVDSWFLDGFAPSKNPDMWSQQLFNGMAKLSAANASVATFTAAGFVRRGLISAGFAAKRAKGFGRKREMLVGQFIGPKQPAELHQRLYHRVAIRPGESVAIIGAGIAGASLAYALVKRGVKVTIYDQACAAAAEASGNKQGAVYPLLSPNQPNVSEFFQHAFNYHRHLADQLEQQGYPLDQQRCGLLQLSYNQKAAQKNQNILDAAYPVELVHLVSSKQASSLAGVSLSNEALYYPLAGWVNPKQLVNTLLKVASLSGLLDIQYQQQLVAMNTTEHHVELTFKEGLQQHDNVVFCQSHSLLELEQAKHLPLTPVRGQVSHIDSNPKIGALTKVLCYEGYLTPASQQQHCIGASYVRNGVSKIMDEQEGLDNLQSLQNCQAQAWNQQLSFAKVAGRVAIRCAVRDHFPLLGALPDIENIYAPQYLQQWQQQTPPYYERCFIAVGFGSRGICSAPFATELLAAQLCGEAIPLKQSSLDSLHPHRFWNRRLIKNRPLELRYR
ncbi:bifunctional tRNA (5-methylaminomethyl-2-thiouridine)(34)-methyltransferase MnmD/FAD-dependent 5-carboxymethylaminomethyl-2-thiouridine(34) oxidoreductase MnmC [Agarivorans sp. TSD2052]|uniref:bifunctional tRNA (5-methylaminomethyl-2-thiouridine)(34)-methyltransferase MnmD/FAD-dependent 5-carboxymethylaminomethyl-2-thiouridine(34) oxidoreductase MnmC n=1 Tax=Agarivorans sp. TSD2052 TaxID=2937286 RepID=UPI00200DAD8D|nr:bifunctional tRNA (5-methylaminomethyl-2-thiouridine)(34)-methyltransferase MnmD/FAD-dependent 5-carboxymethylaminomethyl-2-thiouridine(34) oxidoreductase MnmC [Agarivorans sp. TSD2052]UPW16982.1 bifunctional tRNA (5-methylaminomethyl-2-thiouridine)(34)-methyltransferase MnmD/FAD-dependent 5-carboxymethylaminomethyl-2-thiouridine(34) oxidoreductase MnmC [Agarivorans sp. TSD2052]